MKLLFQLILLLSELFILIINQILTGILTRILLNQSKNSEITELWNEWS